MSAALVRFVVLLLLAALPATAVAQEKKEPKPGDQPAKLEIGEAIKLLRSTDRGARREAVARLYHLGPKAKSAVPEILKILQEEDIQKHTDLYFILEAVGPEAKAAVPLMIEGLQDDNFHVRYLSCRVLGGVGDASKEAVPQLSKMVATDAASVRKHAALALGRIGRDRLPEVVEPLIDAMDDPVHPVREAVMEAIGLLGEKNGAKVLPALQKVIDNKRSTVRCHAARAYWNLSNKPEKVVAVLREELTSASEPWVAAQVLGQIGPAAKDAVPDLIKFSVSEEPTMRLFGAEALGNMGPAAKDALPRLRELLEDPEKDIREIAKKAISKIEPAKPSRGD